LTISEGSRGGARRSYTDDNPRAERLLARWKGRLATDLTSKDVEDLKAQRAETITPARKRRLTTAEEARPREHRPLAVATVNHHPSGPRRQPFKAFLQDGHSALQRRPGACAVDEARLTARDGNTADLGSQAVSLWRTEYGRDLLKPRQDLLPKGRPTEPLSHLTQTDRDGSNAQHLERRPGVTDSGRGSGSQAQYECARNSECAREGDAAQCQLHWPRIPDRRDQCRRAKGNAHVIPCRRTDPVGPT
jgi:hypothetical protein